MAEPAAPTGSGPAIDQLDAVCAEFAERGVVVIKDVFSAAEIQEMREEADAMAEVSLNAMLYHDRRSARCGIGLDGDGEVSILKLQPYIDVSSVFQRVVSDGRIVRPLEAIMGDEAVLMPEKSKLNYKQRLAEGGELFGLGSSEGNGATGNTALSNRTPSDFGRFPIRKCSPLPLRLSGKPHAAAQTTTTRTTGSSAARPRR